MANNNEQTNGSRYSIDVNRVKADQTSTVVAGAFLAVSGGSGIAWLITNAYPTVPNRWAFFALLQITLTGIALPFVLFLHRRFSHAEGLFVSTGSMIRQAAWVGLFGTTCAWLRIPRLLSIPTAIIIALALLIIESLLRVRERTQWRPE